MNLDTELLSSFDRFFAQRLSTTPEEIPLLATLMAISRRGHLALSLNPKSLEEQLRAIAPQDPSTLDQIILGAEKLSSSIVAMTNALDFEAPKKPLCRCNDQIYLQKNWVYESLFLSHIQRLKNGSAIDLGSSLTMENLNAEQKTAVENGLTHPLSIITGGPGTGKTYTAAQLVLNCLSALEAEQRENFRVILAAPTGKAVAHLEKNILKYITAPFKLLSGTLHALLKYKIDRDRDEETTLLADLILIDECSMIDAALFSALLQAIPTGTRIVLIGDSNQLSPVESGSFFADLVDCSILPITHLKTSLRSESLEILNFAAEIQSGNLCIEGGAVSRIDLHMQRGSETAFSHALWACVEKRFPKMSPLEPVAEELLMRNDEFRILCCMRQGFFGVDSINQMLVERYRDVSDGWLPIPVLITRNDYALELYNGDVGFLVKRISKESMNYAIFSGKKGEVRKISAYALPSFEYAYCLSVHKSQGSEYNDILLLAPEGSEVFGREVLYTAVTRARKSVLFDAFPQVFEKAVRMSSRKVSGILTRSQAVL